MSILGSLIEPATKLLDKVIEDKDQKAALAHEIATMAEKHAQMNEHRPDPACQATEAS